MNEDSDPDLIDINMADSEAAANNRNAKDLVTQVSLLFCFSIVIHM